MTLYSVQENAIVRKRIVLLLTTLVVQLLEDLLTDPLTPGKLKKTSGPDRMGICLSTFINFFEWLGCNWIQNVGYYSNISACVIERD